MVLDDLVTRHTTVDKMHPDDAVFHAYDIWTAQSALATEKFDLIYLDFDLNDFSDDSSIVTEDCVLPLTGADFIAHMVTEVPEEHWPQKFVIISSDEEGSKELQWLLQTLGLDFSWDPLPH